MERFARWLVTRRNAWVVVACTAVVGVVAGVLALDVQQDDDVLAFLPPDNPDIQAFHRINEQFGSTDVALVGIPVDDVFDEAFLRDLDTLSTRLRDTPGLDATLTLTNLADFVEDPSTGGIVSSTLVPEVPDTPEGMAALREKVMSREHVVGTFVNDEADAVLVYAFGAPGAQALDIAANVRSTVREVFPDRTVYWGGAPFISTWIFETTQADMAALTPWAIVAIVVLMMAAFRDLLGTALGLGATGVGIAVSRALMSVLDVPFNIVLSSMPILLFAIGSAYAIHILSHYDRHAREVGENPEAVVRTLVGTGPTVITAGLTTVAGLLSFVTMDIAPMRTFGTFTAIGLFVALVTSLTFVPAVIALFPRPVRPAPGSPLDPAMRATARWARRHRISATVVVLVAIGIGLTSAGQVDARMDLRAFFDEGSEPDVAQRFLEDEFGGSQFLQIQVQGDLEEPGVLREVERLADRLRLVDHIDDVQAIPGAVAIINDALSGSKRIPDTRGQAGVLYRFLASDPAVSRLITDDRQAALMQVRIDTSDQDVIDAVLAEVEGIVATDVLRGYRVAGAEGADADAVATRLRDNLWRHVDARAHTLGLVLPDDAEATVAGVLEAPAPPADPDGVAETMQAFLLSEENFAPVTPEQADAIVPALVAAGADADWTARETALSEGLAVPVDDGLVQDLVVAIDVPLTEAWATASAQARLGALVTALGLTGDGPALGRFRASVGAKLLELGAPDALLPADGDDATALAWTVNGMPVLYRGLSRSVTANQFKSLGSAMGLVLLIMMVTYRSVTAGLLATAPTFLTLCLVYGAMGATGVHLDIGTSMLASLILGAGVDYSVHLMAGWHAAPHEEMSVAAERAVDETAHGIWTNAVMVAAGFFVLTLGDARPLKNVGGLTATAMIVAALATFVVIPLFAHRRTYARGGSHAA